MNHPAPAAVLASSLLALALPAYALESVSTADGATPPQAEQRLLLEAYVACIETTAAASARADAAAAATACPGERAAYRATLPDERADEILRALDLGPGPRR